MVSSSSIVWLKKTGSVILPAHSCHWIRSANASPNKSISGTVYARAHNYRCAISPKLSLEKGMGMTPGYNHRLWLRNRLVSETAENSPDLHSLLPGVMSLLIQSERSLLFFFPSGIFFLHFSGRKIDGVFMPLSVWLAVFGVMVRVSAAVLWVSIWGRSEPFIQGCWWPSDKREDDI